MKNRIQLSSICKDDYIPNIDIGQSYDQRYIDTDIHYESLEKLADFFGRNMPVHHHDRFYQLHVILTGKVHVNLDENSYVVRAPMFFLTPPTIPHAFITDNDAQGHVITVRQQLVWQLMEKLLATGWDKSNFMTSPLCVSLVPEQNKNAAHFLELLSLTAHESKQSGDEQGVALKALLQLILIDILRLADQSQPQQKTRKEDIRIFHHFNQLIEQHYKEHLTLVQYSEKMSVTEARLNDICRRLAGLPSKRLITDRLIQEARRLLSYSSVSISEIGYELGFQDPAYFTRFFRKNSGVTASKYRNG
ncbi:4-hydroxyphenylacetate catabolism regulatory protein HpaA [Pseudoalteromonas neustonica]|uniref:4-hydroxyphenylacetate catabolism regulatory protein HpaA n=1 Tax=Pseudoalteromonas neustonica TaxID=1840331 RepID=A0ABU9U0U4_9GAMM